MFQNREEAGILLAKKLQNYKGRSDVLVVSIPRGGVVVGKQIADILQMPLSIVIVKKLGAPYNPELAIGAVAPGGIEVIDWDMVHRLGVEQEYLNKEIREKREEIKEREKKFGIKNQESRIKNKKTIILTDDGVATGATTLAAIKYIKEKARGKRQKAKVVLAVPVIAKDTFDRIKSEVDELIALEVPEFFGAVGEFYREFPQVSDDEVVSLLSNLSHL